MEEIRSVEENEILELVDHPEHGTVVDSKWVFKVKCGNDNEKYYRARLVAKGYTQREGVEFKETFSPVVRHSTFRFILAFYIAHYILMLRLHF